LKIAYFVNHYPKVSHSFIRREILALERQGFEVVRVALRGWNDELPDAEDRRERGLTRYILQNGPLALVGPTMRIFLRAPFRFLHALRLAVGMARDSDRSLPYHLIYLAEACQLALWLEQSAASRVHAHFGTNSAEVVMLAHALNSIPYSFTVHGPDEFLRPHGLEAKIHHSSFVVAISSFGRSQLYLRSAGRNWHKIKVVHCGLEKSFYEVPPIPVPDVATFVCVGRLCEAKGQLLLLEAASRIIAAGTPVRIVLAGDGPMRAELEAEIARLDLAPHVRITGWISSDAVRDEILAARALVLPSFAEGLPVVIMEAMALRRPVLTTYIAGIPELVRPGENGWLFPAGSIEHLTEAMTSCLATPVAALQRFGDAGFDRVTTRHSIETEASRLAALFQNS
jgi:colanic acid/amylovoran biosynthesis glycosyltransferase